MRETAYQPHPDSGQYSRRGHPLACRTARRTPHTHQPGTLAPLAAGAAVGRAAAAAGRCANLAGGAHGARRSHPRAGRHRGPGHRAGCQPAQRPATRQPAAAGAGLGPAAIGRLARGCGRLAEAAQRPAPHRTSQPAAGGDRGPGHALRAAPVRPHAAQQPGRRGRSGLRCRAPGGRADVFAQLLRAAGRRRGAGSGGPVRARATKRRRRRRRRLPGGQPGAGAVARRRLERPPGPAPRIVLRRRRRHPPGPRRLRARRRRVQRRPRRRPAGQPIAIARRQHGRPAQPDSEPGHGAGAGLVDRVVCGGVPAGARRAPPR